MRLPKEIQQDIQATIVSACAIPGPGCETCSYEDNRTSCDNLRKNNGLSPSPNWWWEENE